VQQVNNMYSVWWTERWSLCLHVCTVRYFGTGGSIHLPASLSCSE